jgi:hypothetical protein
MALFGIIFFLFLILIAIRFSITNRQLEETEKKTVIHTSGIYSIVRKAPIDEILNLKPSIKEIEQYLNSKNVDIQKLELTKSDKDALIKLWNKSLENSMLEIKEGDLKGLEFYYYDFINTDNICNKYIKKGNFITRQDIYQHPELIPPFHLGCTCVLKCHHGNEILRETSELGMSPLLNEGENPSLPDWRLILKLIKKGTC